MSRRKQQSPRYANVEYSQLLNDDFTDGQFQSSPSAPSVPWKAISLAILLFLSGFVMLLAGTLIVSGVVDSKYRDRTWPLIILGALMFIPGAYHVRIAYYAYKRLPGYTFEDIPEFE